MHCGLLVLKTDGSIYAVRNPADGDYTLEKINVDYVVDAYSVISPWGRTYCIDIYGDSHEIK